MFCRNCGSQIDEHAVVCPHCGTQTGNVAANGAPVNGAPTYGAPAYGTPQQQPTYATPAPKADRSNPIAIVGFVLSFFVALAGLICSIIGYNKSKKEGLEHQGLALAGIIISAISMAFNLLFGIIYGSALIAMLGSAGESYYALLSVCAALL